MEDESNQHRSPAFQQLQMRWTDQNQYPHSHQGTPAQEYDEYSWGSSPMPIDSGPFVHRPGPQSLQPLVTSVMPPWPSMLNNGTNRANYYPTVVPPTQASTISPTPSITPVSASSARSGSAPRRTLTDDERRKMCQYHEANPNKKQNEIGAMFGVERSTVSKVLRQKDKYLKQERQEEGSRSPAKRLKLRSPDIEKALSKWLEHPQQKGRSVSDHEIREKARHFTLGQGPDLAMPNPANNTAWLDNFKRKNGIAVERARKDSLAADDSGYGCSTATSMRHSPSGISSASSKDAMSPSPPSLQDMRSNENLKMKSPEDYASIGHHAMFTDTPATSFTHAALISPTSPFFTPDSATATSGPFFTQPLPVTTNSFQRPRSQSQPFSSLDQYMSPSTDSTTCNTYHNSPHLDPLPSQQHQCPLDSISETMNTHPPSTVSPAATMRAPPLPAHVMATAQHAPIDTSAPSPIETRLAAALAATGNASPSQDEARRALQVVMRFFQQQPVGSLDLEESVLLGRIGERLTQELKRSKHKGVSGGGDGEKGGSLNSRRASASGAGR